jgi:L-lactate utilization protein LutC
VWGGANDIRKNDSRDGLKHITYFVKNSSHTNIILMNAPHRHDLNVSSCVNNEVIAFNRKVQKRVKTFNNVGIVYVDINREHFIQHGLHMNTSGKEKIARKISDVVREIVTRKKDKAIILKW